jgi:hypothetical protein
MAIGRRRRTSSESPDNPSRLHRHPVASASMRDLNPCEIPFRNEVNREWRVAMMKDGGMAALCRVMFVYIYVLLFRLLCLIYILIV